MKCKAIYNKFHSKYFLSYSIQFLFYPNIFVHSS